MAKRAAKIKSWTVYVYMCLIRERAALKQGTQPDITAQCLVLAKGGYWTDHRCECMKLCEWEGELNEAFYF